MQTSIQGIAALWVPESSQEGISRLWIRLPARRWAATRTSPNSRRDTGARTPTPTTAAARLPARTHCWSTTKATRKGRPQNATTTLKRTAARPWRRSDGGNRLTRADSMA